ncbi:hypothetical protein EVA_22302 [gut metagenome]|uniref:Uncharacterized protein n=1 Tax=gut metagenome TaxID=749906 RepID=J9FJ03_9ZZZZ
MHKRRRSSYYTTASPLFCDRTNQRRKLYTSFDNFYPSQTPFVPSNLCRIVSTLKFSIEIS